MTKSGPLSRGPLEVINHHAFVLMEASDWATSTPIWYAAYRQGLASEMTESDAVTKADETVRQVFPSHSPVDQAAILRDKGFVGTSLTFYGFLSTYYNGLRDLGHGFAKKSIPEQARIGGNIVGYVVAVSVLSEFLRGRGKEPGEEWEDWFLRKMMAGMFAPIPFGGDISNKIEGALLGKAANPRVTSTMGTAIALGQAVFQAAGSSAEPDRKVSDLLRALGPVAGVPISQPLKTGRYLYEVGAGQREVRNPFDLIGGVIYGERDNQPANPASVAADLISGARR